MHACEELRRCRWLLLLAAVLAIVPRSAGLLLGLWLPRRAGFSRSRRRFVHIREDAHVLDRRQIGGCLAARRHSVARLPSVPFAGFRIVQRSHGGHRRRGQRLLQFIAINIPLWQWRGGIDVERLRVLPVELGIRHSVHRHFSHPIRNL